MTANAAMPEQFSPIRLFVTLLVLIFCIEWAIMFALDDLLPKGTPVWIGASIDAGLLTAITSIFVWWLFMRALRFALLSETAQAKAVMDIAVEGIVTVSERDVTERRQAEARICRLAYFNSLLGLWGPHHAFEAPLRKEAPIPSPSRLTPWRAQSPVPEDAYLRTA